MHETLKHGGTLAEKSEVGDTAVLHDGYKTTHAARRTRCSVPAAQEAQGISNTI
jgi:hypothetical protein